MDESRLEKLERDVAELFRRLEKTRRYVNALRTIVLESMGLYGMAKDDQPDD